MSALSVPPPPARRGDVVDTLHGDVVPDPYRWLEDTDSAETVAWIHAQNAATSAWLDEIPERAALRQRLSELWASTRWGVPHPHGERWFFTRHDPNADQPVLRVADTAAEDGQVLLDPNALSTDGTVALTSWWVSPDGSRLAYATSRAGSDWMTWRVREVATGTDLDDVVEWSKWSNAAWLPDSSGFFYGALDRPAPGKEFLDTNDGLRIQLHLIGTSADADAVVYAHPDPEWEPIAWTLDQGRWLVIDTRRGTHRESIISLIDLTDPQRRLQPLVEVADADTTVIGSRGTTFFVVTNAHAPRNRLVAIDAGRPDPAHWREIVPEGADVLLDAALTQDQLVVHVLHDASSRLDLWSMDGHLVGRIALPDHVSVDQLAGAPDSPTVYVGLSSFTDPASVWECDTISGTTRPLRTSGLGIDASAFVVSRAAGRSADGTEVPMFLLHRRDVTPSGEVPTILTGYGGFNIPIVPSYNASRLLWVERGGLLAVANLRGGGEYGQDWYDAGRGAHKQNVFDDFAGCARWLASSGWSRADRIAVSGGSNGDLLVGALLTQHPELIGAAVPEVGVLDLLRYHLFTIGWGWTSDYGNPEDPEQYSWVRAVSPLHNITPGTAYPATLVMTGDHDDRVVPGHSFKFAATLQAAQSGDNPVLIRIETSGGHGAGTPVSKLIEARADMLAFCTWALAF